MNSATRVTATEPVSATRRLSHTMYEGKRHHAAHNIGERDGGCAVARALGVRLFEAELEAHHEIDPALLIGANRPDHEREGPSLTWSATAAIFEPCPFRTRSRAPSIRGLWPLA